MKQTMIIAFFLLYLCHSALAFEFNSGTANGTGQALSLSSPTPATLLTAPSQGLARGAWRIETGFTRLFDLRDLDQLFIAGVWRTKNLTSAFGFSQFGRSDLYSEKLAKLALALQYRSFSFGVSGSFMALSFGHSYSGLHAATCGLSAAWHRESFYAAISTDNLTTPHFDPFSPGVMPKYVAYLEYKRASWSTLGRITLEQAQKPQFAIGQRVTLRQGSALMWGLSTSPLQFGGGVDLRVSSGTIGYTVAYHPVLGMTQTISVSYGSSNTVRGNDDDFK